MVFYNFKKLFYGYECFPACMSCRYHLSAWCPQGPERGIGSPGTGIRGCCEPLWECWEWNSSSPEEQQVFLTTEPSLHPFKYYLQLSEHVFGCVFARVNLILTPHRPSTWMSPPPCEYLKDSSLTWRGWGREDSV